MCGLCDALTEISHTNSPVHAQIFLNLCPSLSHFVSDSQSVHHNDEPFVEHFTILLKCVRYDHYSVRSHGTLSDRRAGASAFIITTT